MNYAAIAYKADGSRSMEYAVEHSELLWWIEQMYKAGYVRVDLAISY